ncbi:hypothetical protein AGDE_13913 [Angomonas deanei]|nr:hypothetical protein AGDE_13913 [Angomonas deanei]|eukprot:EPY21644.1 hypothetical protein AGDE_13913 [Angomonas deanei]
MNRPAGALLGHIPLPPATVTPTNNKEPVKAVESPSIPQKTTPVQRPQKAVVHSNNNNDDDDDDDLPDIDMN